MNTTTIFMMVVLILLLGSCYLYVYQEDFKTVDDVLLWVSDTIEYVADDVDYWQNPTETLELKTGDCEDFCLLFMWLLHDRFNLVPELLIVVNGDSEHAMVRFDGVVYDVTSGRTVELTTEVLAVIPYDELFK